MDWEAIDGALAITAYGTVYDELRHSDELCPWCFGHVRSFYPEFDAAVDEALANRKLGGAPAMQVLSATSTPSAATIQDVVPPVVNWRGETVRESRPRTICEDCGVVDHDPDADRGYGGRLRAVDNIAAHLHDGYVRFDADVARDFVTEAQSHDTLAGHDHAVLRRATVLGLRAVH